MFNIGNIAYAVQSVTLYASSSPSSSVSAVANPGVKLTVQEIGVVNGAPWIHVTGAGNVRGWAPASSFSPSPTSSASASSSSAVTTSYGGYSAGTTMYAAQNVQLRASNSTTAPVISSASAGTPVTAQGFSRVGGAVWVHVTGSGGIRGWAPIHSFSSSPTAGGSVATNASSAAPGWSVRYGSDGRQHVFSNAGKDLGIFIAPNQAVQSTNGGRLWALYNINPNGTPSYVGAYGSVPGAPPPPNAAANNNPAQMAPPPPVAAPTSYGLPYGSLDQSGQYMWNGSTWVQNPAYATQPTYADPYGGMYPYGAPAQAPTYAAPQPVYAAQPSYASALPAGVPGYDPNAAALYAGAAYGAAAAAQQAAAQQPAYGGGMDPLTASVLMGGGMYDSTGYSGMAGGFDASTLAMLSGGDSDLAIQMALGNGGYGDASAYENPLPM